MGEHEHGVQGMVERREARSGVASHHPPAVDQEDDPLRLIDLVGADGQLPTAGGGTPVHVTGFVAFGIVAKPFEFSLYNVVDILVFATLFGWAVYEAQRRVEWHRRLMFVALLNLFGPAFSRWMLKLPMPFPWLDMSPNLAADALLLALAWHDRRKLGHVHPVTLGAALVLIPFHAIEPLIARGAMWNSMAPTLLGFG